MSSFPAERIGFLLLALATGCLAAASPAGGAAPPARAHAAATCADFSNQADAQRAHNTRDADGDGIYCESLPCPCLKPGTPPSHPRPALFDGRCRRGVLPDRSCSPGRVATTDIARICATGYTERVRDVAESTKNRVYREYGIRRHTTGEYEIDHIVPLELGGSNSIRNLYAERAAGRFGFHVKDRLENALNQMVCDGTLDLRTAQHAIASNWVAALRRWLPEAAAFGRLPSG